MSMQPDVFVREQQLQQLMKGAERDGVQKIVVGAIVVKDGRILLLQRHPQEAFLAELMELPSGTVEPGESLLDALVRELFEETGLVTTSIEAYTDSFDYRSSSGKLTRQFNFLVSAEGDPTLSTEHNAYCFVKPSPEDLQDLNVSIETQRALLHCKKTRINFSVRN